MILMEAQDDNYFEIELVVKNFQDAMMKMKYSSKPVAAPYGMTLGGGTEVCLPAASIQASSETAWLSRSWCWLNSPARR